MLPIHIAWVAGLLSLSLPAMAELNLSISDSNGKTEVVFENDGTATALQFDVRVSGEIKVSCEPAVIEGDALVRCEQLEKPNQDLIRFVAINLSLKPLPSGVVAQLSGLARETPELIECSASATDESGTSLRVAVENADSLSRRSATEFVSQLRFTDAVFREEAVAMQFQPQYEGLGLLNSDLTIQPSPGEEAERFEIYRIINDSGEAVRTPCTGEWVMSPGFKTSEDGSWYGKNDNGGQLAITAFENHLIGQVAARGEIYLMQGDEKSGYRLSKTDRTALLPTDVVARVTPADLKAAALTKSASMKPKESLQFASMQKGGLPGVEVTLDLLVVFEQDAQNDAGGFAALQAIVLAGINNFNATLGNSSPMGLGTDRIRVRQVGPLQLVNYAHVPPQPGEDPNLNVLNSLAAVRADAQIRNFRDTFQADIVIMMARDVFSPQGDLEFGACGVAYLQNQLCSGLLVPDPNCGPGADFTDFAYGMVSVRPFCQGQTRNSFPHELGHLLGGEHAPSVFPFASNDSSDASFQRSFAHLDQANLDWGTIMWVPRPDDGNSPANEVDAQVFQFSNALINVLSAPTEASGVVRERENAFAIVSLADTVANYRGPETDTIFSDSIEGCVGLNQCN